MKKIIIIYRIEISGILKILNLGTQISGEIPKILVFSTFLEEIFLQ